MRQQGRVGPPRSSKGRQYVLNRLNSTIVSRISVQKALFSKSWGIDVAHFSCLSLLPVSTKTNSFIILKILKTTIIWYISQHRHCITSSNDTRNNQFQWNLIIAVAATSTLGWFPTSLVSSTFIIPTAISSALKSVNTAAPDLAVTTYSYSSRGWVKGGLNGLYQVLRASNYDMHQVSDTALLS